MLSMLSKIYILASHLACHCLVGYLKDQACTKAANQFLSESIHLGEYRSMLDQGFSAPLTIGGRNLVETLCLCHPDEKGTRARIDLCAICVGAGVVRSVW